MISRHLTKKIQKSLNKGKIIIIYGPRQVGKTTLVRQFLNPDTVYYNFDQDESRSGFEQANLERLATFVKPYKTIIIDEAQRLPNSGLILKILIDNYPEKNFIVTGSSSLDLSTSIAEPLTGRHISYMLFPMSYREYMQDKNPVERRELMETILIYGSYPEIIVASGVAEKKEKNQAIAESYLFKDIFMLDGIKNSASLKLIVQSLALQLGNEVSLQELSRFSHIDVKTVKRYIDLLEKTFVIFSLPPYFTNKRKSISRLKKYYFYDTGIRNALIRNFNPLNLRTDVGALWENFCMVERMKRNQEHDYSPLSYFWRSYTHHEIDLVEDYGGELHGFECKWTKDTISKSAKTAFCEDTGSRDVLVVYKENVEKFINN